MRDLIVQAFSWALNLLFPGGGRHRALSPVVVPVPVSPWARPWTGPSSATARAIFTAGEAQHLTPGQREQFYATAWAELGREYRLPSDEEGIS
ncbi:hypothetical protein [Streptomyces sp. NPDC058953]|uniref:hypothetical protein n=1 Tax=unclassified Streptomyces TaxID=2593676 RepID=UPI0036753DAD